MIQKYLLATERYSRCHKGLLLWYWMFLCSHLIMQSSAIHWFTEHAAAGARCHWHMEFGVCGSEVVKLLGMLTSFFLGAGNDFQSPLRGDLVLGGHRCRHVVQCPWWDTRGPDCCQDMGQEIRVNGSRAIATWCILANAMAGPSDGGTGAWERQQQIEEFSRESIQNLCTKASLCRKIESCGWGQGCNRSSVSNNPFGRGLDPWKALGFPLGHGDLWSSN